MKTSLSLSLGLQTRKCRIVGMELNQGGEDGTGVAQMLESDFNLAAILSTTWMMQSGFQTFNLVVGLDDPTWFGF